MTQLNANVQDNILQRCRSLRGNAVISRAAAILVFCAPILMGSAQDEGTKGKHTFLGGEQQNVRWRTQPHDGDEANPYPWSGTFGNSLTYGIHTHLLHIGWVLNWGYGMEGLWESEPPNPPERYPTVAYNPWLLWNYTYETTSDRGVFGYRRYLRDGDLNPFSPTREGSAHIFCGGSAFDMHGNLIVAGGQVQTLDANFMPFKKRGHPNIFKFTVGTPAHPDDFYGAVTGSTWLQYPGQIFEDRWYPTLLILPDGKILILGGTKTTDSLQWSGNIIANGREVLTSSYEVLSPDLSERASVSLWDVNNPNDPFDATKSYRDELGNIYPRAHLISYHYQNNPANPIVSYVAVTGMSGMIFRIMPSQIYNYNKWERLQYSWATSNNWIPRVYGNSVLLPNVRPNADNPGQPIDQMLNRALVYGGYNGSQGGVQAGGQVVDFSSWGNDVHADPPRTNTAPTLTPTSGVPQQDEKRYHSNATLLPTGDVYINNGYRDLNEANQSSFGPNSVRFSNTIYRPDSGAGTWIKAADSDSADRDSFIPDNCEGQLEGHGVKDGTGGYHHTAILLPNAKVLRLGTDDLNTLNTGWWPPCPQNVRVKSIANRWPTIYSPPYLFNADNSPRTPNQRPQINNVVVGAPAYWGERFSVECDLNGLELKSVALVRPGSVTHSFNSDQRVVKCYWDDNVVPHLEVTIPWRDDAAPPGWYMLFVVATDPTDGNKAIPSDAWWVKVGSLGESQMMSVGGLFSGLTQTMSEEASWDFLQQPLTFEFQSQDGGRVRSFSIPMGRPDRSGSVRMQLTTDLPPGRYQCRIRPYRSWLSRRITVDAGPGQEILFSLHNGDVNGDNRVDAADELAVMSALGTSGRGMRADLDHNGAVDLDDLAIVVGNAGRVGDR